MLLNRLFFVVVLVGMFFTQGKVDGVAAIVGNSVVLHGDVLQQSQLIAMERRVDPSKNPYLLSVNFTNNPDKSSNEYAAMALLGS